MITYIAFKATNLVVAIKIVLLTQKTTTAAMKEVQIII